jgi:hypothetical protein
MGDSQYKGGMKAALLNPCLKVEHLPLIYEPGKTVTFVVQFIHGHSPCYL